MLRDDCSGEICCPLEVNKVSTSTLHNVRCTSHTIFPRKASGEDSCVLFCFVSKRISIVDVFVWVEVEKCLASKCTVPKMSERDERFFSETKRCPLFTCFVAFLRHNIPLSPPISRTTEPCSEPGHQFPVLRSLCIIVSEKVSHKKDESPAGNRLLHGFYLIYNPLTLVALGPWSLATD